MANALVEIKLNSFRYNFRRLVWTEETRIKIPPGEDPRLIVLAHALTDISGMPVTRFEDALKVMKAIPNTLRWRIWVVYRGNQPEDRYYTCKGLYEPPDFTAYNKRLIENGEGMDSGPDPDLERKFGAAEAHEARQLEQQLLTTHDDNARERRQ